MTSAQELLHPNVADYIVVVVVVVSTLISLIRGFLKEFISLFVWALGFWIAIKFYHSFSLVLDPYIASVTIRQIVSFIGIFLLVVLLGALFSYLLSFIIIKSGLSGTDRLLGMIFGFTRGVLLVAVILLLISSTSFVQDEWWQRSILIPHFRVLIDWFKDFIPEKISVISSVMKR